MLAAVAAGLYSTVEEASSVMKSSLEIIEPNRLMAAEYEDYFQRWMVIVCRLREIGEELN
jgi:ribulose kinase